MSEVAMLVTASGIMQNVLVGLLVTALGIFAWLAAISRNVKTFQFQLSVFIIIWIAGELVDLLQGNQMMVGMGMDSLGSAVHLGAMIFFSAMIWLRFVTARARGRKIVEDAPPDYLMDK